MPPFFLFTFRSCALCPCSFPFLSFADLCFRRDHFNSDLFCPFFVLVFLRTSVGGASPFLFRIFGPCSSAPLFVSVLSLGCPFSPPSPWPLLALRFPRVLCLVFLAVDWSRISSTALTSPLSLVCCAVFLLPPFPFVTPLLNKCPSVVLLAADWSGVSLRWSPNTLPTRHCLWP